MISAKWDITSKCNLRCDHCSVAGAYFSRSYPTLCFVDKSALIKELAVGGVTHLSLLGGEPLTLGRQLIELVTQAKELGMTVGVVTNGTLLTEAVCRDLIAVELDRITVSIESATAEQHDRIRGNGTFDKVIHNLRHFARIRGERRSPQLSINSVLCRINRPGFSDLAQLSRGLGADEWTALTLNHTGSAQENLSELIVDPMVHTEVAVELAQRFPEYCTESREFKINIQLIYPLVWEYITKSLGLSVPWPQICCSAARSLVYLAPDGRMYICDRVHGGPYSGRDIGGAEILPFDLKKSSFAAAWASRQYTRMFEFVKDPATYHSYEPCRRCKYLVAGLCEPCPLYSLEGKAIRFSQCLEAEKGLGDISGLVDWNAIPASERRGRYEQPWETVGDYETEDMLVRLQPAAGIRHSRRPDGDGLVYNPETDEALKLNLMANAIWEQADSRHTMREIVDGAVGLYAEASRCLVGRPPTQEQIDALAFRTCSLLAVMKARGFLVEGLPDGESANPGSRGAGVCAFTDSAAQP